jgi:hypothetical protein
MSARLLRALFILDSVSCLKGRFSDFNTANSWSDWWT